MTPLTQSNSVERYWFLTWTTYGSWLPGDKRGFVGSVRKAFGRIVNHCEYGTPPARPDQRIREASAKNLKRSPILLTLNQAQGLLEQFHETCGVRGWKLIAVAIMRTHVHVVLGVLGDPNPEKIRGDLKAWGSRRLTQTCGRPEGGAWWSEGGSNRKLADETAVETVLHYIRRQPNPLVIWTVEDREFGPAN